MKKPSTLYTHHIYKNPKNKTSYTKEEFEILLLTLKTP